MNDTTDTTGCPSVTWFAFSDLSVADLYAVLKLRQDIFILEQQSLYADIDGKDDRALHCLVHGSGGVLLGAIRLFVDAAGKRARIGRVVIAEQARGTGLGRRLMQEGIDRAEALAPGCGIDVSAQAHLEAFYSSLGFRAVSKTYIEDGIPHVDMARE